MYFLFLLFHCILLYNHPHQYRVYLTCSYSHFATHELRNSLCLENDINGINRFTASNRERCNQKRGMLLPLLYKQAAAAPKTCCLWSFRLTGTRARRQDLDLFYSASSSLTSVSLCHLLQQTETHVKRSVAMHVHEIYFCMCDCIATDSLLFSSQNYLPPLTMARVNVTRFAFQKISLLLKFSDFQPA